MDLDAIVFYINIAEETSYLSSLHSPTVLSHVFPSILHYVQLHLFVLSFWIEIENFIEFVIISFLMEEEKEGDYVWNFCEYGILALSYTAKILIQNGISQCARRMNVLLLDVIT